MTGWARRACVSVLVALASGCVSEPPVTPVPSLDPSSPLPARPISFQTQHHFLGYVVDGSSLLFAGGAPDAKQSSPDIYSYDLRTGVETLRARSAEPSGVIASLASREGWLIFAETYASGALLYRVRLVGPRTDRVLDELSISDPDSQRRHRSLIPPPMVATDGQTALWTRGEFQGEAPRFEIVAAQIQGTDRKILRTSPDWINFPSIDRGRAVFGEGFIRRTLWIVEPFIGQPRVLSDDSSVSEGAISGDLVVAKKGGENTLDPAAIIAIDLTTSQTSVIVPASELAWEPSVNERYAVWQGRSSSVIKAYDRLAGAVVTLGSAEMDTSGRSGSIGRLAAFRGAVAWLSTPPGDMTQTANLKPRFNVLLHQ
jgi:hypothetical protein